MRFLLDTNVLSDLVRGEPSVSKHFKNTPPDDAAVSTVTTMEIDYGLALQPDRAKRIAPLLEAVLEHSTCSPSREPMRVPPGWSVPRSGRAGAPSVPTTSCSPAAPWPAA